MKTIFGKITFKSDDLFDTQVFLNGNYVMWIGGGKEREEFEKKLQELESFRI